MSGTFQYYDLTMELDEFTSLGTLERIELLGYVATKATGSRTLTYIRENGTHLTDFVTAVRFVDQNLPEIVPAFEFAFPAMEIEANIHRAIQLTFSAFYKEAIGNLRAGVELSLLQAFFTRRLDKGRGELDNQYFERRREMIEEIRAWLRSEKKTPHRKEMIKVVRGAPLFDRLINETSFRDVMEKLFEELDRFTHTRGATYSHYETTGKRVDFAYPPEFHQESLQVFLNLFVRTIQIIAIIAVANRPKLIDTQLAAEVERQANEPLIGSGLWGGLSDTFFELIPESFERFFISNRS